MGDSAETLLVTIRSNLHSLYYYKVTRQQRFRVLARRFCADTAASPASVAFSHRGHYLADLNSTFEDLGIQNKDIVDATSCQGMLHVPQPNGGTCSAEPAVSVWGSSHAEVGFEPALRPPAKRARSAEPGPSLMQQSCTPPQLPPQQQQKKKKRAQQQCQPQQHDHSPGDRPAAGEVAGPSSPPSSSAYAAASIAPWPRSAPLPPSSTNTGKALQEAGPSDATYCQALAAPAKLEFGLLGPLQGGMAALEQQYASLQARRERLCQQLRSQAAACQELHEEASGARSAKEGMLRTLLEVQGALAAEAQAQAGLEAQAAALQEEEAREEALAQDLQDAEREAREQAERAERARLCLPELRQAVEQWRGQVEELQARLSALGQLVGPLVKELGGVSERQQEAGEAPA